jgi:hypothetical protein
MEKKSEGDDYNSYNIEGCKFTLSTRYEIIELSNTYNNH